MSKTMADSDMPVEIEYKLVVTENAAAIFHELSQLHTLVDCVLGNARLHQLHDYYFDTSDRQLGTAGIALRLRQQNGEQQLAIKAKEQVGENGLSRRFEWDQPWQAQSFALLFDELARLGVSLAPVAFSNTDAISLIQQAGFDIIQDRTTQRIARTLTCPQIKGEMELALDHTCYQVGKKATESIDHFEIELEIDEIHLPHAQLIVNALCNNYPGLIPWRHNKLITGLAMQQYPDLHKLQQAGSLGREGYEQLHVYIEQQWRQE